MTLEDIWREHKRLSRAVISPHLGGGATFPQYQESVALCLTDLVSLLVICSQVVDIFKQYGLKKEAQRKRLEAFITWAEDHRFFIVRAAHALVSALLLNSRARAAFGVSSDKPSFRSLLNGAWDLQHVYLGLFGLRSPDLESVFVTADGALSQVYKSIKYENDMVLVELQTTTSEEGKTTSDEPWVPNKELRFRFYKLFFNERPLLRFPHEYADLLSNLAPQIASLDSCRPVSRLADRCKEVSQLLAGRQEFTLPWLRQNAALGHDPLTQAALCPWTQR